MKYQKAHAKLLLISHIYLVSHIDICEAYRQKVIRETSMQCILKMRHDKPIINVQWMDDLQFGAAVTCSSGGDVRLHNRMQCAG